MQAFWKIKIRARTEIEDEDTNNASIIITEMPYQVNKADLVKQIAELVRDKKVTEISDIRAFHSSDTGEKVQLIDSTQNKRVSELGSRIIFRNFPEHLNTQSKEKIKKSIIQSDLISLKGKSRRKPDEGIKEAESILLKDNIDTEQTQILKDYISYLNHLKN